MHKTARVVIFRSYLRIRLRALPNAHILKPANDIEEILGQTRGPLVPSSRPTAFGWPVSLQDPAKLRGFLRKPAALRFAANPLTFRSSPGLPAVENRIRVDLATSTRNSTAGSTIAHKPLCAPLTSQH